MFCRQNRHWIIQLATAAAFSLHGSSAFAVNGPSFDCSRGVRQTLAAILCTNQEAAQADWDLSTAYWASFTDNGGEKAFSESIYQRCALPRVEMEQERTAGIFVERVSGGMFGPRMLTAQPVTEQHVRCIVSAFHNRAAALRSRLTGDALTESNLSPDNHIDIQAALARKGFLQNRVRGYGANADGQFGPNTRAAIRDLQRSIGAQATGFLSSEQRLALVGTPEEREVRAAPPAEARAKQDAMVAGASARTGGMSTLIDQTVCRNALGQSGWDENPSYSGYVAEAERRGLTVNACRQMLGPAIIATAGATAPASSPLPAQESTLAADTVGGRIFGFFVLIVGVIWLVIWLSNKNERDKRAKDERSKRYARDLALSNATEAIKTEFPFVFSSTSGMSVLCMDRQGERLRFVDVGLDSSIVQDLTVPISSIVSVELSGGNEVVTDYETTSSKPDALVRAFAGGQFFGQTGAIVGAISAGSEATTVATQRVIEKPSVLVFELSDLNNPVVRFSSMDHEECDLWLHRVRSAMAQQKRHTLAASG
jgi:peptidoglycan hydrolase-like protein with peptidoglycan-binding domain